MPIIRKIFHISLSILWKIFTSVTEKNKKFRTEIPKFQFQIEV